MQRQVLAFALIGLLFSATIGLPAFTHICHTQSKSWSSLVVPAKSCCSKKKKAGETITCHVLPVTSQSQINKTPCCEDELGLLQINSDFIQHENVYMPLSQAMVLCASIAGQYQVVSWFVEQPLPANKPHGPPLNLFGRSLLIDQQVFRC